MHPWYFLHELNRLICKVKTINVGLFQLRKKSWFELVMNWLIRLSINVKTTSTQGKIQLNVEVNIAHPIVNTTDKNRLIWTRKKWLFYKFKLVVLTF